MPVSLKRHVVSSGRFWARWVGDDAAVGSFNHLSAQRGGHIRFGEHDAVAVRIENRGIVFGLDCASRPLQPPPGGVDWSLCVVSKRDRRRSQVKWPADDRSVGNLVGADVVDANARLAIHVVGDQAAEVAAAAVDRRTCGARPPQTVCG